MKFPGKIIPHPPEYSHVDVNEVAVFGTIEEIAKIIDPDYLNPQKVIRRADERLVPSQEAVRTHEKNLMMAVWTSKEELTPIQAKKKIGSMMGQVAGMETTCRAASSIELAAYDACYQAIGYTIELIACGDFVYNPFGSRGVVYSRLKTQDKSDRKLIRIQDFKNLQNYDPAGSNYLVVLEAV